VAAFLRRRTMNQMPAIIDTIPITLATVPPAMAAMEGLGAGVYVGGVGPTGLPLPIGVAEVVVPSPFAAVEQIERMSAPLWSTATRDWSGDSRAYHNVNVCASRLAINIAADRNWRPSIGISFSLTSWMELIKSSFVVAFATSSPSLLMVTSGWRSWLLSMVIAIESSNSITSWPTKLCYSQLRHIRSRFIIVYLGEPDGYSMP